MHENDDIFDYAIAGTNVPAGMELLMGEHGLSLVSDGMELCGDFGHMLSRVKNGKWQHEMLVRAAKPKNLGDTPLAVDATAGLGEDAFLLAAAGFRVCLFERDPVIAALLRDAIRRALRDEELAEIVSRMEFVEGDSIVEMPHLPQSPDVVLLDPMFPAKRKDAVSKKKLQMLQHLERPCEDETALMHAAMAAHPRKIIVKRPLKGPFLAGVKPDYSLKGKTIRYDCYVYAPSDGVV